MRTFIKLSWLIAWVVIMPNFTQAQTEFVAHREEASTYNAQTKGLRDAEVYTLDTKQIYDYFKGKPNVVNVRLKLDEKKTYNLKLLKNDLRAANYKSVITTQTGEIAAPDYEVATYQGVIDDDNQQWVRLLITEDRFEGYFNAKEEKFVVESLKNHTKQDKDKNKIVTFSATQDEVAGICGASLSKSAVRQGQQSATQSTQTTCRVLEIAADADWEWYNRWGLPYADQRVLNFLNVVEGVYQNTFQLRFVVVFQNIYTQNNDPYTIDGISTGGNTAADEMRDFWNANRTNVSRDLAHLFSGKDHNINGVQLFGAIPAVNGVGQFGAICANPAQSYSFTTDRSNGYASTAHEMGHNFNAQHSDGSGCCGAGQTDISQCPNASIMCQGPKKLPIFFNAQETSVINTHINNSGGCLGNNATITLSPSINGNPGTSATLCNSGSLSLNSFFATSYTWTVDPASLASNGTLSPSGGSCYVNISGFYRVVGTASNSCGSSSATFYLYKCGNSPYRVYPNPASDVVQVEFDYPEIAESLPDQIDLLGEQSTKPLKSVNVQDVYKRKALKEGRKIEFDVRNLPRGTYYLHIKNSRIKDKEMESVRVVLE